METGQRLSKQPHPKETTNVLLRLLFFYDIKLFAKGYRKSWENGDLFDVLKNCRSQELGDALEEQWKVEKNRGKSSICRALWKCFGKRFIFLGLIQFFVKIITTAFFPQALSKLVAFFSPNQEELSKTDAIFYSSSVIILLIINLIVYYNCMLALTELGIKVRTSICSLLFRKSMKLSSESLSQITVGKIVTIMTKDVNAFSEFIYFGNDVWVGLIQTGLICYLIYTKIGIAAFAGVAFFAIMLPLQAFIGKLGYGLRLECSKRTDERLTQIQEVLSSIKIIKMYTWESFFEQKINFSRKKELKKLHRIFFTKVWIGILGGISSKMAFFIFFMTYVWMGYGNVTAENVYYILSCFSDLEYSFSTLIPLGLSFASEAYATAKRVEKVLTTKELPSKTKLTNIKNPKIVLSSVSAKNIFENVSFNIGEGLNVVVGATGSGKTNLLKTILQEFQTSGDVKIFGKISYASQEPWLFPSTIKNNILFEEKYNEKKYEEILKICSLDYDLELLGDGDNTIIIDGGKNLSKGQQTRINLARALYKESDIYLLDDCLASLDVYVSEYIFDCLVKFLKNKVCVFVTNNPKYIKHANKVFCVANRSVEVSQKSEVIPETVSPPEVSEETAKKLDQSEEIYHEKKKSGKVSLKDYYKYVIFGGGIFIFILVMLLFIAAQGSSNYSDKILSDWVTLEENIANYISKNRTNVTEYERLSKNRNNSLYVYISIVITSTLLNIIKSLAFFYFTETASTNIHKTMVKNILKATMSFFDTNFIGHILNRFSKDCLTVDEDLPFVIKECLEMVFVVSGGIILLATVNYIIFLESLCLLAAAYLLKRFCQPTGRNLQRLNVSTRSPIIGHLNSTLEGLITIRAANAEEKMVGDFDNYQNVFTSVNYTLKNCNIALEFGLELLCSIFISVMILQFLIADFSPSVGDVGLVINQSFIVTEIISSGIKCISECENQMTSFERLLDYTNIKEEDSKGLKLDNWPQEGSINYRQISLNYNQQTIILNDINFDIKPKQKLAIVGRTGAGKSSIISTLLRLYETKGTISVDGVDINVINTSFLRSKISIIPQDVFLFGGTIRENLDPLNRYKDEEIWKILEEFDLKKVILDLNTKIDKGFSFSAGQKQLFCLARVILLKNKIVVLDEATANVDEETSCVIQEAIQRYFSGSTVIIIAHKLSSVMRCDNVLVLDKGRVREFGPPLTLLEDAKSFLYNVNE